MTDTKMKPITKSSSSKDQKNENIQVFVRVRPQNTQEKQEKCGRSAVVLECNKDREIIVKERANTTLTKTFTFDRVFAPDSKQIDVYKQVVNPLIDEVLAGYNCTVFAYGQTGTGKTFTMEGERSSENVTWEKDPLSGIIPRVLSHIFDELRCQQIEFTMAVSYLELYNEELIDLLSPIDDSTKLRLFEDAAQKGSLVIQGLQEILVLDKKEVYDIMNKGSQKRQTAATLMNAHSSRSHTIFTVTVHIREITDGEELLRTGKINLVDLAGSENIGRSGAKQQRAREAGNINQSLLTLGRVITALVERTPHVPYRESKLTRLLQDSLGGRTKTSIIATVSPVLANLEETLSTLDYAHRAKSITNRPEINQRLTKKALLKEYTTEIERLRRDLEATRDGTGVVIAHENYQHMTQRLEKQDLEISENIQHIRALEEEREKKEAICERLHMELQETTSRLTETTQNLQVTREVLQKTEEDKEEKEVLLQSHITTEQVLSQQASTLLFVADESTTDLNRVHDKLDHKRSVEQQNFEAVQQFNENFSQKLAHAKHATVTFANEQTTLLNDVRSKLSDAVQSNRNIEESSHEQISSFLESHGRSIKVLETSLLEQAEERQQWSQEQLKCTHDVAKSQIGNLHNALTRANDKIIQLTMELQNLRDNTAQTVQDTLRKVESQEQNVLQFMRQQVESIANMHQSIGSFTQLMSKEFQRSQEQVSQLMNNGEASYKLEEENMAHIHDIQRLMQLVQNNHERVQAHREEELKNFHKLSKVTEDQENIVHNHASSLGEQLDSIDKHGNALQRKHEQIASDVTKSVKLYDNTLSEEVEAVMIGHKELSQDIHSVEVTVERGWQEHTTSLEQQFRELAERAHNDVQNMGTHIQDIKTLTLHQAEEQATISEARQKSLSDFVEASQAQLSDQNVVAHKWSVQHGQEISEIGRGMHELLTQGIKKDEPTGNTPQRRVMEFPRQLKATSPHERILQRFRTAKLQNQEPFKCPSMDSVLAPSSSENSLSRSTSASSLSTPSSPDDLEGKENGTTDLIMNIANTNLNLQKSPIPNKMTQDGSKSKKRVLGSQN